MIAQRGLPFNLESTAETLISQRAGAGWRIFFCAGTGGRDRSGTAGAGQWRGLCAKRLRCACAADAAWRRRSLDNLRQLHVEASVGELVKLARIPSSDAVGDRLRRMGAGADTVSSVSASAAKASEKRKALRLNARYRCDSDCG
jgi:hypothetical protein